MKFCVLGKHIAYSLSPLLHGEIFQLQGHNYAYEIFDGELAEFLDVMSTYAGFNVTIPYKQAIIPHLHQVSPEAQAIGAVNTVKQQKGRFYGYNTDCMGIAYTLQHNNFACADKNILLIGCGGAARAAAYVLKQLGASTVFVKARGKEEGFCAETGATIFNGQYDEIDGIINASPVGTGGKSQDFPVKLNNFTNLLWSFDMVYNPIVTGLQQYCMDKKIPTVGGLEMLVAQAVYANGIWLDVSPQIADIPVLVDYLQRQLIRNSIGGQNIYLCGFMAAGKTTMGRALAQELGMEFLDTDLQIEQNAGTTIGQIFEQHGQAAFRQMEQQLAETFCNYHGTVISLGGGFLTSPAVLPHIQKTGKLIFIDTPLPVLQQRLQADQTRPLAHDCNALYHQRLPLYKKNADLVFQPSCTDCIVDSRMLARLL